MKPLLDQLLAGKYDQSKGIFQFHPVVAETLSWLDGQSFDYAGQSIGTGPRLGKFVQRCLAYVKSILEAQMFMSKPVQNNLAMDAATAVSWIARTDDTGDRLEEDGETWAEIRRWFNVICMSEETKDFAYHLNTKHEIRKYYKAHRSVERSPSHMIHGADSWRTVRRESSTNRSAMCTFTNSLCEDYPFPKLMRILREPANNLVGTQVVVAELRGLVESKNLREVAITLASLKARMALGSQPLPVMVEAQALLDAEATGICENLKANFKSGLMVNVDTIMQSSSYNIALPTTVKNRWAACYRMHCVLSKLRACKRATTHAGSGSSAATAKPETVTFELSHETKVAIDGLAEVCFLMLIYSLWARGTEFGRIEIKLCRAEFDFDSVKLHH